MDSALERTPTPPKLTDAQLQALVRRSRVLDPVVKRQWLQVLPHLSPLDRERLYDILRSAGS
jgi:hypothetical protein